MDDTGILRSILVVSYVAFWFLDHRRVGYIRALFCLEVFWFRRAIWGGKIGILSGNVSGWKALLLLRGVLFRLKWRFF